jgi:hypothetical protein
MRPGGGGKEPPTPVWLHSAQAHRGPSRRSLPGNASPWPTGALASYTIREVLTELNQKGLDAPQPMNRVPTSRRHNSVPNLLPPGARRSKAKARSTRERA